MKEYGVKAIEFNRWDKELYNKLKRKCDSLIGQRFYVKQADTYIRVTRWFDQECDISKGTKSIILVFECDEEVQPEVTLKVLNFENAAGKV